MATTQDWSKPMALSKQTINGNSKERAGVYRIRAFSGDGIPIRISRCQGVDHDGILHIGESVSIRRRLREFLYSASTGKLAAGTGTKFHRYGFHEQFAMSSLYFDFVETNDKGQAEKLEFDLHEEYRRKFHDKPPLDGSRGKRGKKR
ncbi:MAG TPA: hypothetical protein VMU16_04930 [Candidatus Binataceae bacterium]|nr:hypothetical protein [Candidatus Binataceae bacterium]